MDAARPRGGEELVAGLAEMLLDGRALVVVEHVALGADRRALDDLSGRAREVQQEEARPLAGRQRDRPRPRDVELDERGGIDLGPRAAADEGRDEAVALEGRGPGDAPPVRRDLPAVGAQAGRGQLRRDVRSAVGPAAADRDVHSQAQLARLARGERDLLQEPRREIPLVADAAGAIVEGHGIHDGQLEAAAVVGFEALFDHAEPALQRLALAEPPLHLRNARAGRAGRRRRHERRQEADDNERRAPHARRALTRDAASLTLVDLRRLEAPCPIERAG